MSRLFVVLLGCFLWTVVGCAAEQELTSELESVEAMPTVHTVFSSELPLSEGDSTRTPRPTLVPLPTLTPVPTIETKIITIYGDELHQNWTLNKSRGGDYQTDDNSFSYQGANSIVYRPEIAYADLAFTVSEDSDEIYLRENVLAVRFWLYSDVDYVDTDDLLVTVVGSNDFPYWVEEDDSVIVQDDRPVFPATRLYYLNIEDDIPPGEWIQVELWLNELVYDPEYEFVTGVYLKNDEDFFRTIYVDEVEFVLREN